MLLLKPVVGDRPLLNLGANDEASDVFGGRGLTSNMQWYFHDSWMDTNYIFSLVVFPVT